MRKVYLRQVEAACQSRPFIGHVADSDLLEIENGILAKRPAALSCRRLLAAARAAHSSDPAAAHVDNIGVARGYRSASSQLEQWNRNFPRYYLETRSDRAALDGGEFGEPAAALLTRYVSRRISAPGFSLDNNGLAIDFVTTEAGVKMGVEASAQNRDAWMGSCFFGWLGSNAAGYSFFQNTSIDEPWHWEFRAGPAAMESIAGETVGSRGGSRSESETVAFTQAAENAELRWLDSEAVSPLCAGDISEFGRAWRSSHDSRRSPRPQWVQGRALCSGEFDAPQSRGWSGH